VFDMRHPARTQSAKGNFQRSEQDTLMADATIADASHPSGALAYTHLPVSADKKTPLAVVDFTYQSPVSRRSSPEQQSG
jgi:hypothetical protein